MATIKDIVLIHMEDTPVSFARVESILPDPKKDWYQIKLLMLQIPLQVTTWILKDEYINGGEYFMNGKKMRLELVKCPGETLGETDPEPMPLKQDPAPEAPPAEESTQGEVISFADLKASKTGPDPNIG